MIKRVMTFILMGLFLTQIAFADVTVFSGNGSTILAGHASDNVIFQVLDDMGNPNTGETVNFKVVNPLGDALTDALLHESSTPDDEGKVSTLLKGDHTVRLGNYTITATLASDGNQFANANVIVKAGAAAKLTALSANQTLEVNTESDKIKFKLTDKFNNGIQGKAIEFLLTDPDGKTEQDGLTPNAATTDGNGEVSTKLNPTGKAGNYSIQAQVAENTNLSAQTSLIVKPPIMEAGISIISGGQQTLPVDTLSDDIVFKIVNADQQAVVDEMVNFSLKNEKGQTVNDLLVTKNEKTDDEGEVNTRIYATTVAGTYTLTATLENDASQTVSTTIAFSVATKATLQAIAGDKQSVPAGEISEDIVFQVKDIYGNSIPDETVNFTVATSTGETSSGLLPNSAKTDAEGKVSTRLEATILQGSYTITARLANNGEVFKKITVTVAEPLPSFPSLGFGVAVDKKGNLVNTTANFYGGTSVNNAAFNQESILGAADIVSIRGAIAVDDNHVGEMADIIIAGKNTALPPHNQQEYYFFVNHFNQLKGWDTQMTSLGAFQHQTVLSKNQIIDMYINKPIGAPGIIWLWFGYRLANGTIVFNGEQTISLWINP